MKIYLKLIFLTFFVIILTGCDSPGSEFIGTWKNVKNPLDIVYIEENGDNFILTTMDNKEKLPLLFVDSNMTFDKGVASGKFIYLEKTGTLMLSIKSFLVNKNYEYERVR